MDKKVWKGTTFTRNNKNFKENIWKAKKGGLQFNVFRKSLKWRVEAQTTKTDEIIDLKELGFEDLEDAFDFIINFKK
jgi:hypothetical protein